MEAVIVLLGLLFFGALLIIPIVALVLAAKARSANEALRRDLNRLRLEVHQDREALRARLGTLEGPLPAQATPSAPATPAAVEPGGQPEATTTPPPTPNLGAPPPGAAAGTPAPAQAPTAKPPVPPMPPEPPPRQPRPPVDWERWLGVRGAAVLGGAVLALAAGYFAKYSIEHGLVPPIVRFIALTLAGLACVAGSERLRGPYESTANPLAGAGAVILYVAFWAGKVLWGIIGMEVAFVLMALTTGVCSLLSVKRGSLLIALFGLAGGFATPLVLASGSDRPIGLFGYVLLLDAGFLYIARKRRWPLVAALSLVGTVLLQGLWIGLRMGPEKVWIGLGVVALFAVVFAASGTRLKPGERGPWLAAQGAGVLFPYAFALYFAGSAKLGDHLYPLGLLLCLLAAGALWVGRTARESASALPVGAATASFAVLAVWLARHSLTLGLAWEFAAVLCGLAAVFHLFAEIARDAPRSAPLSVAPLLAGLGLFALLIAGAGTAHSAVPWPWLLGSLALGAALYRQAAFPGRAFLQLPAAAGLALTVAVFQPAHAGHLEASPSWIFLAWSLAVGAALLAVSLGRRGAEPRRFAAHAAALYPLCALLGLAALDAADLHPLPTFLTASLALAFLTALAATPSGRGPWLVAGAAVLAAVQATWLFGPGGPEGREALVPLAFASAGVLVFAAWPLAASARFRQGRSAWYASALSGPFAFLTLLHLFTEAFGKAAIGLVPIALAMLALAVLGQVRALWPPGAAIRTSALAWYLAVALGFVSVAIPLQLDKQWITIGWALQGLAVIALWERLDHPGLKWFGLALHAAVTVRLVANPAVLDYYERGGPILNWLLYSYWVPALALLASFRILKRHEVARARPAERRLYARGHAAGATALGLCAIAVIFAWINLAISNGFDSGPQLALYNARDPARDLARSISWAVYAVVLLGVGMAQRARGLRWVSLGFLVITIGKVFLYDLGQLRDLYRVLSLLGLAVSLILVSLAYQRFVFRSPQPPSTPAESA